MARLLTLWWLDCSIGAYPSRDASRLVLHLYVSPLPSTRGICRRKSSRTAQNINKYAERSPQC